MKKICFITTIPGTLRAFVLKTASYIYENGDYEITFICDKDDEFANDLPSYIRYIPIKMERGIKLSSISSIISLYKIFKKEKFDMIQYSTPNASLYCSIAGYLAGVKVRLYCQWGIRYVGINGFAKYIFKFIEKLTCRLSTWIEPDSYGNLKFSHREKLYSIDKSSVIWNGSASGIDLNKFNINYKDIWKKEIMSLYDINDNDIILGFVGRLHKDKGINELLQSYKDISIEYDNIKLLIVGSNDNINTIDQSLYEWSINNNNIIYIGKTNEVEKYLSVMDIFILPSYREGFGSVILEAEAMGIPVIVSDIPGPTDAMINRKTGLVVEKCNTRELVMAIKYLIENENIRESMGEKGLSFVKENFECKKFFEHILYDRKRLLKERY